MSTKIMSVTDVRRDTSAVIRAVQEDGDLVYITLHGRPAAVLLGYEQYESLIAQSTQTTWPPYYFEQTYGILADNPITRPKQGDYPERELLS